jgi:hypothetical protein
MSGDGHPPSHPATHPATQPPSQPPSHTSKLSLTHAHTRAQAHTHTRTHSHTHTHTRTHADTDTHIQRRTHTHRTRGCAALPLSQRTYLEVERARDDKVRWSSHPRALVDLPPRRHHARPEGAVQLGVGVAVEAVAVDEEPDVSAMRQTPHAPSNTSVERIQTRTRGHTHTRPHGHTATRTVASTLVPQQLQ